MKFRDWNWPGILVCLVIWFMMGLFITYIVSYIKENMQIYYKVMEIHSGQDFVEAVIIGCGGLFILGSAIVMSISAMREHDWVM